MEKIMDKETIICMFKEGEDFKETKSFGFIEVEVEVGIDIELKAVNEKHLIELYIENENFICKGYSEKFPGKKRLKFKSIENYKKLINQVINGEENEVDLKLIKPCDIVDYIEEKGLERTDTDQNGWEYDFWWSFQDSKGNNFEYTGGWYFGTNYFKRVEE